MSNLEFSFIARATADPGSRATTTQYSRKKVLVRAKQPVRFSGERRGFVGARRPGNVSRILSSIGGRHAIWRAWSTARRVTGRCYDTSEVGSHHDDQQRHLEQAREEEPAEGARRGVDVCPVAPAALAHGAGVPWGRCGPLPDAGGLAPLPRVPEVLPLSRLRVAG